MTFGFRILRSSALLTPSPYSMFVRMSANVDMATKKQKIIFFFKWGINAIMWTYFKSKKKKWILQHFETGGVILVVSSQNILT